MQPIEIALFGAVVALAAGLIGYILWPFARARRARGDRAREAAVARAVPVAAPTRPAPGLVCPACQREYDAGLQFCPHDARELVPGQRSPRRAAPRPGHDLSELPALVRRRRSGSARSTATSWCR